MVDGQNYYADLSSTQSEIDATDHDSDGWDDWFRSHGSTAGMLPGSGTPLPMPMPGSSPPPPSPRKPLNRRDSLGDGLIGPIWDIDGRPWAVDPADYAAWQRALNRSYWPELGATLLPSFFDSQAEIEQRIRDKARLYRSNIDMYDPRNGEDQGWQPHYEAQTQIRHARQSHDFAEHLQTIDTVTTIAGVAKMASSAARRVLTTRRISRSGLDGSVLGVDDTYSVAPGESLSTTGPGPGSNSLPTPSAGDLSQLGSGASGKGNFTKAGHSLSKHGAGKRTGNSAFPAPKGNPSQINEQAQKLLDEILNDPAKVVKHRPGRPGEQLLQISLPDGRGAVYKWDGTQWIFSHFAENLF